MQECNRPVISLSLFPLGAYVRGAAWSFLFLFGVVLQGSRVQHAICNFVSATSQSSAAFTFPFGVLMQESVGFRMQLEILHLQPAGKWSLHFHFGVFLEGVLVQNKTGNFEFAAAQSCGLLFPPWATIHLCFSEEKGARQNGVREGGKREA